MPVLAEMRPEQKRSGMPQVWMCACLGSSPALPGPGVSDGAL
jgi:hypothetical protein